MAAERDLGIWVSPEGLTASASAELAQNIEALGYSTMWVPEAFGRDPFAQTAFLGAATTTLRLATGIANVYHRHPGVMVQGANTVGEQTGGRFLLGLGVSSPVIVNKVRGLAYDKPLSYLREYLADMEEARYHSVPPAEPVPVVLAALGPKMLAMAAERTDGAHPYNMPPEHTALAREIMGADAELMVEQKVMLTNDVAAALPVAAEVLRFYCRAPGYVNAWKRLGISDDDIADQSDAFVQRIVAIGDEETIQERIDAHFDAGASHVCIQPLHPTAGMAQPDHEVIKRFAPQP